MFRARAHFIVGKRGGGRRWGMLFWYMRAAKEKWKEKRESAAMRKGKRGKHQN